jgi:hypothetical protein
MPSFHILLYAAQLDHSHTAFQPVEKERLAQTHRLRLSVWRHPLGRAQPPAPAYKPIARIVHLINHAPLALVVSVRRQVHPSIPPLTQKIRFGWDEAHFDILEWWQWRFPRVDRGQRRGLV